jgi:cytochrome oxidase Cu insertion factor (SCO1/SenC/PrrC family)
MFLDFFMLSGRGALTRPRRGASASFGACLLLCCITCAGCQQDKPSARVLDVVDSPREDGLPILYTIPAFSLLDSDGQTIDSAQLRGQPYIVSFFFTRCTTMCPPLMQAARALRDTLDAEGLQRVRLISISVDPQNDTPATLKEYARRADLDLSRWSLVTGPPQDVSHLVNGAFRLHAGEPTVDERGMIDIAHSGHFVLVDDQGRIRKFISTDQTPDGGRYPRRADAIPVVIEALRTLPAPAPP